ncbi:hypothetical protein [Saccharopolyspora mangrovi]|uniref:Secreted protein n=1 Tax=Saccharopolyspora mangrovi TaxID=3082379 RepID=A0ABU6A871_9PSEU|nr:hypothetical protein [Saccharopolyspora sp. S2-29]MEB3367735.1 hypothetical protein [Saccharopolyspora sp. S2-29]
MGSSSGAGHSRRAFLSASAGITGAVVLSGTAGAADLRPAVGGALPPGEPIPPQQPDAQLRALLARIDERRIEEVVRELVSFGTRHTLSSQRKRESCAQHSCTGQATSGWRTSRTPSSNSPPTRWSP